MQSVLVSAPHKALALNPANPAMLCNLLPMARPFPFRGHTLYAVPHTLDVVRLLRNVGVPAPSPILYQYSWPCSFPNGPFAKQQVAAEFLTLHPRAFNLSEMGTGKSITALWAFDYLRSLGLRKRLLVVAPLSTLERTWGDEIFKHLPHLTFAVLHGTAARRRKLLAHPFDVYIVNHDGVEIIAGELAQRPDIDVVAVDEIAVYRNSQTDKYKAAQTVCKPLDRWVWGLTGTPTPTAPTDAWAQIRLVNPSNVPKYFGSFRSLTMYKVAPYRYEAKPTAIETVRLAMQPAIRLTREELPPTTPEYRHIALTTEQKLVYEQIRLKMKAEVDAGTVRAVNMADRLMKLVQVAAGAVYTTDGETVSLDNSGRIQEVLEICEQAEGKIIVFVPFVAALENVRNAIARRYPTELVYGQTSKTDRDQAFWRFQNLPASKSRVLLANPTTMSHGLTLTEANTIVWLAPTTSSDVFDQANHRITRPGQVRRTYIVMLEGTPVERQIYARLQKNQDAQDLLLEVVSVPL
ncbi:SNF2-related protein [Candidimonas nitroreducens]|uniref:DNA helicase n=1 Tax=Candidimonas nitroreducens TaxID=683354 RepID=A0A225LWA7_9BURK|nr:DEAD/DEAH box helicase [Candidimonas nitroreducens]OWT53386.1 DNA helicase [Candidimonas nitroreducens]